MRELANIRTTGEWLRHPLPHELIVDNPLRVAVNAAFRGAELSAEASIHELLAQLIKNQLIIPAGDDIFLVDGNTLLPLHSSIKFLQEMLGCCSAKQAYNAAHILETSWLGYHPVSSDRIARECMDIYVNSIAQRVYIPQANVIRRDSDNADVYLKPKFAEFGTHDTNPKIVELINKFFTVLNSFVNEEHFFEKMLLYPMTRPQQEKLCVVYGAGGAGKSLFAKLMLRFYGAKGVQSAGFSRVGHAKETMTRSWVGKRCVILDEIESPSAELFDFLKGPSVGSMTVKELSTGTMMQMPCYATFSLFTNYFPSAPPAAEFARRLVVREIPKGSRLLDHMTHEELDVIEFDATAGDIMLFLLQQASEIENLNSFEDKPIPEADFVKAAKEFINEYPGTPTIGVLNAYSKREGLSNVEKEAVKEVFGL